MNVLKICIPVIIFILAAAPALQAGVVLTPRQELGKRLFFDANLSDPPGQSCASCHDPAAGFADPDKNLPVSEGVVAGRFGKRNTPTAAYARYSRFFAPDPAQGGQFWDGRARTLTEQAKQPFLNPVEMHNTVAGVVRAVKSDPNYYALFEAVLIIVFVTTSLLMGPVVEFPTVIGFPGFPPFLSVPELRVQG